MKYRLNYKRAKEIMGEKYTPCEMMSYNDYRRNNAMFLLFKGGDRMSQRVNAERIASDLKPFYEEYKRLTLDNDETPTPFDFVRGLVTGNLTEALYLYCETFSEGYDEYILIYYGA